MSETSINEEKAQAILESIGDGAAFCEGADYWPVTDEDGEHLWQDGDDRPLATNHSSMSWYGIAY